jgi:exonuclease SbcD
MRIAVTADLHLRTPSETPERYVSLEEILKSMTGRGTGLLVIAGDLFDADMRDFSGFESILGKPDFRNVRVLAIPGNHDPGLKQSHFALRTIRIIQSPTVLKLSEADKALTIIPYGCATTFSDAVATLSAQPIHGSVLIGHGDFVSGRTLRSNPYEAGFYMPLSRRDLDAGHFPLALLGHIHAPCSSGDVHYPGSPCPVDRSETGKRSYIELDLTSGTVQRIPIRSGLLYSRQRLPVVPGPGEVRHVRSAILGMAETMQIQEGEMETLRVSIQITGFAESRAAVGEACQSALTEAFGRREYDIDTSGLLVAEDQSRAALAAESFRRLSEMKDTGFWPAEAEAPEMEQVAEQALRIIYGVK